MGQLLKTKVRVLLSTLLVGLLLISCGTSNEVAATDEYKYKVTVNLKDEITKAQIEEAFDGKVVGWYPNAGIATVETNINIDDDSISQQGLLLDLFNIVDSTVSTTSKARAVTPVAQNGGGAWANGGGAWANGGGAWANGVSYGYFTDNKATFEKIRLFETHEKVKYYGQDVVIAVIDSGLDLDHPMFQDRLDSREYWKDFIDGDNYPEDTATANDVGYGHGTAVAGVILQVAPRAKILPIRVIGPDGTGDTDDIAAAIEYAVTNGAHIINLSLGTDTKEPAIEAMLSVANQAGILTIASAGNAGADSLLFPANVANKLTVNPEKINQNRADPQLLNDLLAATGLDATSVLGVSSVNTSDTMSTFSSYGATMDLAAPGENIVTAYPGAKFVAATGTSFAAPLVTGAMALAIGEVGLLVSPQVLLGLSAATAENIASKNNNSLVNSAGEIPRLDIYNFMRWGMGWDTQPTPTEPTPTEPTPTEPQPVEAPTQTVFYSNYFNNGSRELVYHDEMFSNNGNNAYEDGINHSNNTLCKTKNTCLEVKLGGKDNYRKDELSGAYALSFTLDKPTEVNLRVQLRTLLASTYESDEFVSSLIYVDDKFIGNNNEIHISKLIGGGVSPTDSGWIAVNKSLGVLSAGEHFILIGGYNNKKTYHDEVSSILIDDLSLIAISN